jgi:hypothetical protein
VDREELQDKAIVGEALLIERVSQHKQHVLLLTASRGLFDANPNEPTISEQLRGTSNTQHRQHSRNRDNSLKQAEKNRG